MQALSIELEDETVAALEAERELFGFESRQAYVRWIIDHRDSIEAEAPDPDRDRPRDRLLADHSERIARLEEQVATLSKALDRAVKAGEEGRDTDERAAESRATESERVEADDDRRSTADASSDRDPGFEVRGSPRMVRQGPDSREQSRTDSRANAGERTGNRTDDSDVSPRADEQPPRDGSADSSSDTTDDESESGSPSEGSGTLSPERVARIPEDPVHEDAGVLGAVETERLDELSRRAVATTRKRLNRDVQTGLEYTSSTRLAGDGIRPGEDITDLDSLSIPGRSTETVEKRRHAVGRALAYLRDEGRARRSDFVDALYADCPAGYDTADGWWRCIKEGLKQVDAVDGGEGTRVWRYRG
ncbi:hypothetical protein [Halopiger djelfimassiliensis]|uniref:hypothetical protein n=1 Tax=Halopiger djelfimassiliensis TaxID=1293047 RepID=UPI000677B5A8|nr:hypothetical protein [Halopiger djelfimassiliensis]